MPKCLALTAYTAKHILDRKCRHKLLMCLELSQIDYLVSFKRSRTDADIYP